MCAKSLFFICGLAFVSLTFALPQVSNVGLSNPVETIRNSTKQVQNVGRKIASKITDQVSSLPQNLGSSPVNALRSLSNTSIENVADVNKLMREIESATDNIFKSEMANIQSWNQDKMLAPFQKRAEEGLTIARDRLKESTQEVREQVTEALENAQSAMSSEEFSQYLKELQQVIEVELTPVRQYFMDAAEAITQVSNDMATKADTNASSANINPQKRSSRVQKNATSQRSILPRNVF